MVPVRTVPRYRFGGGSLPPLNRATTVPSSRVLLIQPMMRHDQQHNYHHLDHRGCTTRSYSFRPSFLRPSASTTSSSSSSAINISKEAESEIINNYARLNGQRRRRFRVLVGLGAGFAGFMVYFQYRRASYKKHCRHAIESAHEPRKIPSREDNLATMESYARHNKQFDVLVIGGGATGAGTALDAVTI